MTLKRNITPVKQGMTTLATFVAVYPEWQRRDNDGNRIKSTVAGVTTSFVSNWFAPIGEGVSLWVA